MKIALTIFFKISLLVSALLALSACGQKGPLELEQPQVNETQTEKPKQTK